MNTNNENLFRETKQRKRIMEILSSTKSHPTADWVYLQLKKDFPNLSLSTIYRNLRILKQQKRILKLPFGHTFDRFDGNPVPHPHFVCQKCGRVFDLEILGLENLFKKAAREEDFKIKGFNLSLYGLCKACKEV
ncbi:MAG: transcriptional repressor [Acidobacteriota bacterium]